MRIKDLKGIINEEEQVKIISFVDDLGSTNFMGRYENIPTYLLDKEVTRITTATELDGNDCLEIGGATVITYMFIYIL